MKNVKRSLSRSFKVAVVGLLAAITVLPMPGVSAPTAAAKSYEKCGSKYSTQDWGVTVNGNWMKMVTQQTKSQGCFDTFRITNISVLQHDCFKTPVALVANLSQNISRGAAGNTRASNLFDCTFRASLVLKGNTFGWNVKLKTDHEFYVKDRVLYAKALISRKCC